MVKCPSMTEEFSKQENNYRAFAELIAGEDVTIDVAKAALLIARIEYSDLDPQGCLTALDALAHRVRVALHLPLDTTSLPETTTPLTILDAINMVLFEQEGFRGNERDYYNPDNSFLNKVLENHIGIPISLSLLYMEVAKRVGLHIEGVGLPFHFVVRCTLPTEILYIDPFEGGLLLSEQDCRERIRRFSHGRMNRLPRHFFEPVKPRQLLVRMLGNLKSIYIHQEDYAKALAVAHYILLLIPDAAREIRDRGMIHLQLKHYAKALHDLKAYLKLEPQAEDKHEMQEHIRTIQQTIAMLN